MCKDQKDSTWEKGLREMGSRVKTETDGGKGCDFFDPLLVVCDLISWRTLLAEPEDPTRSKWRGEK